MSCDICGKLGKSSGTVWEKIMGNGALEQEMKHIKNYVYPEIRHGNRLQVFYNIDVDACIYSEVSTDPDKHIVFNMFHFAPEATYISTIFPQTVPKISSFADITHDKYLLYWPRIELIVSVYYTEKWD